MLHRKIYVKDTESCTGCRICEIVCSLKYAKSGVNPRMARIRIEYFPEKGFIMPNVCRLCTKPACISACPEKALLKDSETGVIRVNEEMCDGCGKCIKACKFKSITLHPLKNIALVCDLCGGDPQCVKYCMNGTLLFLTAPEYKREKGKKREVSQGTQ